ncbi:MAG: hypothetical protein CMJ88_02605 [Planctomycetes bacterium]|nr:hypothetical protein [Planctomycetota bacterium]
MTEARSWNTKRPRAGSMCARPQDQGRDAHEPIRGEDRPRKAQAGSIGADARRHEQLRAQAILYPRARSRGARAW